MSQNKGEKANKGKLDTLLGDPKVNTKVYTHKEKEKGQKDKVGINDIGIFEFIFHGLPNPPELEGMDEDRLRELQNVVQEQLHQRDKERERNITKRVQEFKKTFDFVNSHPLKGVVTMAELTKTDNRQPIGNLMENLKNKDRTHLKPKRQMKLIHMIALTVIITMIITLPQIRVEATDPLMIKVGTDNLEASHIEIEAKDLNIVNVNFRTIDFREVHFNRTVLNTATITNPTFR